MFKDFWKWHKKKGEINNVEQVPFFHEGQIWFSYVGANVGFEQDGSGDDFQRPVLILKKFNRQIFWGIPLTKSNKKIHKGSKKYYFSFTFTEGVKSTAILSQLKLIDAHRLSRHIGSISKEDFKQLKEKLKALLP